MSLGLGKWCGRKDKSGKFDNTGPHIELEIGNSEGKKWISENKSLHDDILLEVKPETEFWRVERHITKPLWSFHVLSSINQKKMYVTYNNNSDDVTLEYEDDDTSDEGNKRYFTMLFQRERMVLLRSEKSRDRYLHINGGKLEMLTKNIPTKEMEWLITPSFELIDTILRSFSVQIQQVTSSHKWISEGVEHDHIQARQTSKTQQWVVNERSPEGLTFSARDLYVTNSLQFGTSSSYFTVSPHAGGLTLRCISIGQYVTAPSDGGDLYFEPTRVSSTAWEFTITNMIFEHVDKNIIFPELSRSETQKVKV